jgi:hypothetical protein
MALSNYYVALRQTRGPSIIRPLFSKALVWFSLTCLISSGCKLAAAEHWIARGRQGCQTTEASTKPTRLPRTLRAAEAQPTWEDPAPTAGR